jgi:uncharacterized membrane protein
MHVEASELVIYFSATAFLGWILESVYRSIVDRQWVNAGFLFGPFVPIYGVGAMTLAGLYLILKDVPWYLLWPILLISPTIIEYSASLLLEKVFGLRLWDYGERRFNVHGRVCLFFSGIWAILAMLALVVINPFLFNTIGRVTTVHRYFYFGALLMYFLIDGIYSILAIVGFKKFMGDLKKIVIQGVVFIPSSDLGVGRMPIEIRKIIKPLKSHPHLASSLKPILHVIPEPIAKKLVKTVGTRHFK